MDAEELLTSATMAVAKLEAQRKALRDELAGTEQELNQARRELVVLEGLAERYGFGLQAVDAVPDNGWSELNRQEASLRAMREIGGPVSLQQIVGHLRGTGRKDDTVALISAALASLKTKGMVESVRRGVWQIATKHETVINIPASLMPKFNVSDLASNLPVFRIDSSSEKDTG
jgi:hypothetical protein